MKNLLAATTVVALLLLGMTTSAGSTEITVYPALAADRVVSVSAAKGKTTAPLGVRKLAAKGSVALYPGPSGASAAVGHKILVTDLSNEVAATVDEVDVDNFFALSTLGHLFVLPDTTADLSATGAELLQQAEGKIVTEKTDSVAVYFARKSDRQVQAFLDQVVAGGPFDESVAQLSESTQKKLDGPELATSIVAKLKAPKGDGEAKGKSQANTLLIAASPDTMGAAPGLATGGSSSGLAVFMELLRLFNGLYSSGHEATKGLNLIFLLGKQGRLSYPGTAEWLEHQDNNLLDNLDFALCLDEVAGAKKDGVYVHTTKTGSKDADLKDLFDSLKTAVGGELVAKKINASHHEMRWEHEVFSYRNVNAATLSASKAQRLQLARSSLVGAPNTKAVEEHLAAVTAKVAQWILSRSATAANGEKIKAEDINAAYLASWLKSGAAIARPGATQGAALSASGLSTANVDFLSTGIKEAMSKVVTDKSVGTVTANYKKSAKGIDRSGGAKKDLGIHFYGPMAVTMTLHTTKTTAFEATLLGGALGSIFVASTLLFGMGKAFAIFGIGK